MTGRKVVDILKARGFTDAEITSDEFKPFLTNQRFISALEAEDEAVQTELDRRQSLINDTDAWYQREAVPALNKAIKDATTARGEAARLTEQLKTMQDYGLVKVAEQTEEPKTKVEQTNNQNPDPRYVSVDIFNATVDRFGEAIGTATDIAEDHRDLFGKRLPGGISALRKEYQDAIKARRFQGDLRAFWEQKFNVTGEREKLSQKAEDERVEKRAQEIAQQRFGDNFNPLTRPGVASRNPFVAKAKEGTTGGNGNGKQPWERGETTEQRRGDRVVRFAQKVMNSGAA